MMWIAGERIICLSYPVRTHGTAAVSAVSWFCDQLVVRRGSKREEKAEVLSS